MLHRNDTPIPHSAAPAARRSGARVDSVLVVGSDAMLAARPATAVQLAHAALKAGFDAVIPASWGDEIIAAASVRMLAAHGPAPAVFCACPHVASRVLAAGPELAPFLVSLVPPPVAVARYLRALYAPGDVRLSYVGRCPGAQSEEYDARVTPDELLRLLAQRDIFPSSQPEAFDAVVPPDRRRHHSLAGGLPAVSALREAGVPHVIVELTDTDLVAELAQHLLDGHPKIVDAAIHLGCACAGAGSGCANDPRVEIMAAEPPRAQMPVIDVPAALDLGLEMPVPVVARGASDLVAALVRRAAEIHALTQEPERLDRWSAERAIERAVDAAADVAAPRRRSPTLGTPVVRPPAGVGPVARGNDGRVLPRAYVARRRSGPRPAIDDTPPDETD